MRFSILSHQLDEQLAETERLRRRHQKVVQASQHLQSERDKLDAKLQLLQEERLLVDQHLHTQAFKQNEIREQEAAVEEQVRLLRGTLASLQAEMDKLRLLAQGVRGEG